MQKGESDTLAVSFLLGDDRSLRLISLSDLRDSLPDMEGTTTRRRRNLLISRLVGPLVSLRVATTKTSLLSSDTGYEICPYGIVN